MAGVKAGEESPSGPADSVGFLLSQLGHVAARRFHRALAPIGLDPRQFLLLRLVATSGGASQQSLGDALSIPASRMVSVVDDLEHRGLVERRPHPTDRRIRELHPTARGRHVLSEAMRAAIECEEALCTPLTPEERRRLIGLLQRLAAHQELDPGVHPALSEDVGACS